MTTMEVLADGRTTPRRRGGSLGILVLAGSLLMTFIWFMVVGRIYDHPQSFFVLRMIFITAVAAIEHLLWLYGLVLITRRGGWKRVDMVGWGTRLAALGNLFFVLAASAGYALGMLRGDISVLFLGMMAWAAGCVCRLIATIGGGVTLLRWVAAANSTVGRWLVLGLLWFYLLLAVAFLVTGVGNFIGERGWSADLENVFWFGGLSLPVASGVLLVLYKICPAFLEDPREHAFPVELGGPGKTAERGAGGITNDENRMTSEIGRTKA